MNNKQKMPWLKLLLWGGLGIHIILIAVSFIEVAIYSLVINPGQAESFYTAHAQNTAPIISIIFGIIVFYILAKRISKNKPGIAKCIAVYLVIIYTIVDIAILTLSNAPWQEMKFVLLLSFITKLVSAYAGALTNQK